jgi:phage major head subunit gpT-like protein/phage head maturation protease
MTNKLNLETSVAFIAAEAQAEGQAAGPRKFSIEAYTGAAIRQGWSAEPIVIDLAGMKFNQKIPIVLGHDYTLGSILGQATSVRAENGRLYVEGEILANSDAASRVVELADKGFAWQASVGADVMRHQKVNADQQVSVNGQVFNGPVRIVKASKLREVSFVTLGADDATSARIAAEEAEELLMADTATETPVEEAVKAAATEAPANVAVEPEKVEAKSDATEALQAKLVETIQKVENMEKLLATRDSRGPAVHVAETVSNDKVIEAALCLQGGLPHADKAFDGRTLEAADKIRRTTSIGEVLIEAARANGYTGPSRISAGNAEPVIKAAFATHDISNLLGALVNKFLLAGFNAVESSWQEISAVRSVNDFKAINLLRLNGDMKFKKVGNAGELKVAQASDTKRSVAADTYGISTQLTRQDMINDDLNALSQIPQRMGRGAALAMNEAIWSEFQSSNDTYFQKATAGSGNALSLASLKTATAGFRKLTDPDGNPLGIQPRVLLVPPELEITAAELMTSALLISGNTTKEPNANVLQGRYRVVVSNYLTSASTWWLAADAADLPALDVVFLNGQQAPTIEQVSPDYQLLGVAIRGFFDFGVTKSESLSCYRMATA